MSAARFTLNDGGRAAAGFRGKAGDCAARAIAIACGVPYREAYDAINEQAARERPRGGRAASDARTGVWPRTVGAIVEARGWTWIPTMQIGSGCRVHLRREELPAGRLIVRLSRHYVAVIDGVIHDTTDPARDGTRCVYGYWRAPG